MAPVDLQTMIGFVVTPRGENAVQRRDIVSLLSIHFHT